VKSIIGQVITWLSEGKPVALSRVVEVVGSGVRPAGAAMAVASSGEVAGSASGGCVEGALVEESRKALADDGRPRLRTFGCSDDEAFDVGLTCGGVVRVLIERLSPELARSPADRPSRPPTAGSWLAEVVELFSSGSAGALVEVADGPEHLLGAKSVVREGETGLSLPGMMTTETALSSQIFGDVVADLAAERSAAHTYRFPRQAGVDQMGEDEMGAEEMTVFVDTFPSPRRMVIFGAASFTAALTGQAKLLGYHVTVCDARPVFASKSRFPLADEVVVAWPGAYLQEVGATLGPRDAICVLNHDPKFDLPAIVGALATNVGYIGVMGSRRTQEDRRRRLREAGVDEAGLARLRGPIGLDIGASTSAETAVSICAEIIASRSSRTGRPLASHAGPIHAQGSGFTPASVAGAEGLR
jgi:xanthine dehydrogenase accessory factor